MSVPAGFLWGAATAAAQIEGAVAADGKGESIWDRFAREGKVPGGLATLDRGSAHYQRWSEDVDLIAGLGLSSYRFSISWPRIFPEGSGQPNQKGLDFYKRLVFSLNDRGVQPAVTLYHWDLPQALQARGGWLNRAVADRFAEYAETVFRALGADVPLWMTLNEPFVVVFEGHVIGAKAPGLRRPFSAMQAAHHLLLAHGKAVQAFRASGLGGARIGLANFLWPQHPAANTPADQAAARRADGMVNRWYLDPVLKGVYPEDIFNWFRSRFAAPRIAAGDLQVISQPIDFLGVQYYSRIRHRAFPWNLYTGFAQVDPPAGATRTAMGWEVYPEGLYEMLVRLKRDYGNLPLIITESGAAYPDTLTADGRVEDTDRVRYLQTHIRAALRALADGVNLQGYYVWSLMDNVEWQHGTGPRFGLIHIDYETMKRTPKASARWYRAFIRGEAGLD